VFRRLSVYLRTGLVAAVATAVLLVLFKNRGNEVSFWFFGLTDPGRPFNVFWLVLSTAGTTILIWRVSALGVGLWKDWRSLKADLAIREAAEAQRQRELALVEREKQVDEKLRAAQGADARRRTPDESKSKDSKGVGESTWD